ncbi:hypothetical protein DL89DRAFT_262701 [Linderina pennispora]|uniref:Uncharacterized protein n=1 Tax=Linderina pennispora TaxID=61395 RepID=A0A1Y1VSA1_9FUNG|nr:uncharacterized protein DL89DRAFT_262701 [Linderina pennispora]ORX64159.1 hypothetical protein DL89DRAFT_262701 [Linderina pennispora]
MSDEKQRMKIIVNSDGSVPEDIETGLLSEQPGSPPAVRGKEGPEAPCHLPGRFLHLAPGPVPCCAPQQRQLMRSVFGNERVDRWMAKHPCHGGEQWGKTEGGGWVRCVLLEWTAPPSPPHHKPGDEPGFPYQRITRPWKQPTKQIEETVAHILEQINKSVRPAFQMMANSRINHTALAALSRGELAATDSRFPVPRQPQRYLRAYFSPRSPRLSAGSIGSSVRIVSTSASEATFSVRALASDPKIAEQISLKQTTDEEGNISFVLEGPKILRQGESSTSCIPAFVYGQFDLDSKLARAIDFGKFEVNSVTGKLQIPSIHGEDLDDQHGDKRCERPLLCCRRRWCQCCQGPKSTIVIETVSGTINTRVSGGFDGSFLARNIVGGRVSVEDASDGTNRLHFVKDYGNYKSGTFGPADSTQAGFPCLFRNAHKLAPHYCDPMRLSMSCIIRRFGVFLDDFHMIVYFFSGIGTAFSCFIRSHADSLISHVRILVDDGLKSLIRSLVVFVLSPKNPGVSNTSSESLVTPLASNAWTLLSLPAFAACFWPVDMMLSNFGSPCLSSWIPCTRLAGNSVTRITNGENSLLTANVDSRLTDVAITNLALGLRVHNAAGYGAGEERAAKRHGLEHANRARGDCFKNHTAGGGVGCESTGR